MTVIRKRRARKKRKFFDVKEPRDISYWKPEGCKDYLTLKEMSQRVQRDPSWLRLLEKEGRIPKASRVKRGALEIRLWSPQQADEIAEIISHHRPGRPRTDA